MVGAKALVDSSEQYLRDAVLLSSTSCKAHARLRYNSLLVNQHMRQLLHLQDCHVHATAADYGDAAVQLLCMLCMYAHAHV